MLRPVTNQNIILLGITVGLACLIWFFRPAMSEVSVVGHYGAWALLPATITLLICFITRNVIVALALGIFAGGLVIGRLNILDEFLIPSLATENYAQILLIYMWALGGLLGLWNRNGGARYFAQTMANKFVRSRRSAKLFAWGLGILFHQGGTISTVLAGTTVRPVSDKFGVAHEELAYIVDSTASPIATLIPFNVWPVYVAGLLMIEPLAQIIPDQETAIGLYMQAILFNFYAWIAVVMTLLFALGKLPLWGTPMSKVVARVKASGDLDRVGSSPVLSSELSEENIAPGYTPHLLDFFVPISTLLSMCIVPWLLGGTPLVFEGFGLAVVSAIVVSVIRGMPLSEAINAMLVGIKGVTLGAVILALAVTLALVSQRLGTPAYVIGFSEAFLSTVPFILPALLLVICMVVAFSIGSSWGTYAVIFPIALPLALSLSSDPTFLLLSFGAIMGGAVFGDQCSPISDTTVLASLACGSDLMDHVNTQLPLALAAAGLSGLAYTLISIYVLN